MDLKNFSAVYAALNLAEKEVKTVKTADALQQAKRKLQEDFNQKFPLTMADFVKGGYVSQDFFKLLSQYPELLKGNEEKLLHLLAAMRRYQRENKKVKPEHSITVDVFDALSSSVMDDFVWKNPDSRRGAVLSGGLQAVRPLIKSDFSNPGIYMLLSERIPVWQKGYPEVMEGYENIAGHVYSEAWF